MTVIAPVRLSIPMTQNALAKNSVNRRTESATADDMKSGAVRIAHTTKPVARRAKQAKLKDIIIPKLVEYIKEMNPFDCIKEVRRLVTVKDVCMRYGIPLNEKGFTTCFIHGEKTPSLRVYPGNRGFYCFGCHAHGDVVDFVGAYFGISTADAVKRLNNDFCLGLPLDGKEISAESQKALQERLWAEQERIRKCNAKRQRLEDEYRRAADEYARYEYYIRTFRPHTEQEQLHPLFVEALNRIGQAEMRMDEAKNDLYYFLKEIKK